MYELIVKIANLIWDEDPYESKDQYDTFPDFLKEMMDNIEDKGYVKSVHDRLVDCETDPEYAQELAREVSALC